MTENKTGRKFKIKGGYGLLSLVLILCVCAITVYLSDDIREGALFGMRCSLLSVIPGVLPFMVLGDFISSYIRRNGIFGGRIIASTYQIPKATVGALISGLLCGFPSGAKLAAEEYDLLRCDKTTALRLCAVANNPSPAFIIGGIGYGMIGNQSLGVILLVSLLIASVITSRIFGKKQEKSQFSPVISGQKFDFVLSVKNAGLSCINIFSFMTLFCAGLEVIKKAALPKLLFTYICSILEIGSAGAYIASTTDGALMMLSLGFAIGFGGLCAHLQSLSFISSRGLDFSKYLIIKLTEGVICALLSFTLFLFFKT